nr:GlsB/YeaQ/YmgE family stress response membrane protein [Bacillus safensis]
MEAHDRGSIVLFIIGIVIAFFIAFLGFTVLLEVGNGGGTAISIIGAVIILLIAGRLQRKREQNEPNIMLDKMMMLFHENGFHFSKYFFSQNVDKALAVNEEAKKIRFIKHQSSGSSRKSTFAVTDLSLKDIHQVEILEDGVPSEHSIEIDYTGAFSEEISTLQLRLTMNDKEKSTITITFLQFDLPVSKNNAEYLAERESLDEMYHHIDVMMKSAD